MRKTSILYVVSFTITLFSCNNEKKTNIPLPDSNTSSKKADTIKQTIDSFEETVYNVIQAFEKKDDTYLNSIVPEEHGVVVLFRTGVFNEYKGIDRIDFKNPVPQTFPYPAISHPEKLQYEDLPKFNCGTMEWSKAGLYCDTIHKDTLLSGTPMNLRKYRGDKIADTEINRFKELEKTSRRIVLATPNGDLIFYLTLLDNKWYLTVIDRVTTDCSA